MIAAHAHHTEAKPSTVKNAIVVTAARFATPKITIRRSLEMSAEPQVAATYKMTTARPSVNRTP